MKAHSNAILISRASWLLFDPLPKSIFKLSLVISKQCQYMWSKAKRNVVRAFAGILLMRMSFVAPFVTGTELGPGGELRVAVEITRDHFTQDYDQYSFYSSFLFTIAQTFFKGSVETCLRHSMLHLFC